MTIETLFFWTATLGYAVAALFVTAGLAFKRERLAEIAFRVTLGAFALQTASIVARWIASGRLPYVANYENVLAGTWFIVFMYLLLAWRRPSLKATGVVVLPFVLLTLGYSLTLDPGIGPVTPAYKSIWLGVHVLFAWASYSAYTVCAALATIELLKSRKKGIAEGSLLDRAPDVPQLQELTFRLVAFGFLVNGVMIASGAIWAYELWGAYWRWDPVETWSLITWLAFGFYMHARLTLRWRGKPLAWLALFALFGIMMTFWGVQFAPSIFGSQYHLFRNMGALLEQSSRAR